MSATAAVVQAAQDMRARGYAVVPVRLNKRPLGNNWRRIWHDDELDTAFKLPDIVGVGFLGGALSHNIVPIDFDTDAAEEWWQQQHAAAGLDPDDYPTVLTPRPGKHRYVSDVRGTLSNAAGALGKLGIDLRGAGQAVLPPSPHPNGGVYAWAPGRSFANFDQIPACPDFVYDAIAKHAAWDEPALAARAPALAASAPRSAPGPATSDRRIHAWCRKALDEERARLAGVGSGSRNRELNTAALKLGAIAHYGAFSRSEAFAALEDACIRNGYIQDDGRHACEATFASGWAAGEASPRTVELEDRARDYGGNDAPRKEAPPDGAGAVAPDLGIWDAGDDDYVIPPREWLLGTSFCRTFVSALIADGAVGKTTLRIAQHLALTTGRSLTGEHVFTRAPTLLLCFEDDRNELRRRVLAAMLHHDIAASDIKGWLFLGAIRQSGMKLAMLDGGGNAVKGPLEDALGAFIATHGIALTTFDPFVKTHALEENSNPHMDFVTGMLADMASAHNMGGDLLHHTSKGPADAGNADRGRGASSTKNAGRLVNTLTTMSGEEAQGFNIAEAERRSYVRMDNAKVNLAPPSSDATWFRLVSVRLDNGTPLYPNGDEVQAIEPWSPPGQFDDISHRVLNMILDRIDAGLDNGERYTDTNRATDRAVWHVFSDLAPNLNEKQARNIVGGWKKTGLLYYKEYVSKSQRKPRMGFSISPLKRPS